MRRFLYIMLAWVIALIGCDTEDNIGNDFENFFIKYYGDEGNQTGIDLIEVEDGFLLLGTSQRTAGDRQVLLVKTDELGNQLWWQTYGGMDDETPVDFELGAGNVVYIGANVSKTTDSDVLIIKVDAVSGSQLDSLVLGDPAVNETINGLLLANNGDIVTVGITDEEGSNDVLTYRLTQDLGLVTRWRTLVGFGSNNDDRGMDVLEDARGQFIFFATSNSPPEGNSSKSGYNFYVYPTDDEGFPDSFEEQYYGSTADQYLSKAKFTLDGGTLMIGTSVNASGLRQLYLSKTFSNFSLQFEGQLPNVANISGKDVLESRSGGVLVLGESVSGTNSDIYLAKVSSSGAEVWSRQFGGIDNDQAGAMNESVDGSIHIIGTVELENQTKMVLIKTTDKGDIGY